MPDLFRSWKWVRATVEELGDAMGVDPDKLAATVASFNAAVCPGEFDPSTKDGKHTTGLEIDKTNWAMSIFESPFRAVPG